MSTSKRLTYALSRLSPWSWVLAGLFLVAAGHGAQPVEETYPSLTVGATVYTNVTVLNKTREDVFIRHAHGMANLKVRSLDQMTQLKLGYAVDQPKPTKMQQVLKGPDVTDIESNAQVQEVEEALVRQAGEYLERLDQQTIYSLVAFVILFYLLFCYLCRCICVKTSNPPSALIWLPWLKLIPLFKAAGMSPAWILSSFIPPVFTIASIIWCFRIVRARAKPLIYAFMLLLPITNIVAFFYLALSSSAAEAEDSKSTIINLGNPPRRDAA